MRCSMCGHENPPGASFCLSCGTALGAPMQTPPPPGGLPVACAACRVPNPPGMKFCRNCGSALAAPPPGPPPSLPPVAPGPPPLFGAGTPAAIPPSMVPGAPLAPPMAAGPPPGPPSTMPGRGEAVGMLATLAAPPPGGLANVAAGTGPGVGTTPCPRCGAQTPSGLPFCQQCGVNLQAVAATDPGARSAQAAVAGSIDPQGATMAAPPSLAQAAAVAARAPAASGWGSLVLVNRDGSDGERFALRTETVEIGRAGAEIAFAQDRFLARSHARLERTGEGVRLVCLDATNGVFRRVELPVELEDGAVLLAGRQVLRYEQVGAEEAAAEPLVQHGVALFGSPPRAPWGRLLELLPSGGVRDIRHLNGAEFVIGREEGDWVVRDDAFLSRRHVAINWDGQRARLTDLGSSNGTFLRLTGKVPLRHGEHLRMGDQLFRVELA